MPDSPAQHRPTDASPASDGPDADAKPTPPAPEPNGSAPGEALQNLLSEYVLQHLPDRVARPHSMQEPPRAVGTHARLIPFLRAVPWGLGVLFVLSFVWDFPDVTLQIGSYSLVVEGLLRILSVSGLIGFLTNWLAITMLFQPRAPRPLVGQGLVPAQRERIAYRLAQAVSDELISEEIIKEKIHESGLISRYQEITVSVARSVVNDPDFRADLKALAADYIRDMLTSDEVRERIVDFTETQIEEHARGLPGLALRAYRFLNEEEFQRRLHEAVITLPESIDPVLDAIDPVLDDLPDRLEARADTIEDLLTQVVLSFVENLDVERIVVQNVRAYDERQLEELLKRTTNEQLNYIKYLGGVLGTLGGFVIWAPFAALTVFGLAGGAIYLVDETLYRLRR